MVVGAAGLSRTPRTRGEVGCGPDPTRASDGIAPNPKNNASDTKPAGSAKCASHASDVMPRSPIAPASSTAISMSNAATPIHSRADTVTKPKRRTTTRSAT